MALDRPADVFEEHRSAPGVLAEGTLACPRCDAPVAPDRPLRPSDPLRCPVCDAAGSVRDFLSLDVPSRPARVLVRVSVAGPHVRRLARR